MFLYYKGHTMLKGVMPPKLWLLYSTYYLLWYLEVEYYPQNVAKYNLQTNGWFYPFPNLHLHTLKIASFDFSTIYNLKVLGSFDHITHSSSAD